MLGYPAVSHLGTIMGYRPLAATLLVLAAACNQQQNDYRDNQAPLVYEDTGPEILNTKWGPMTRAEYENELRRRRDEEAEQSIQAKLVPPPRPPQPPVAPDPDIGEKLVSQQKKKPKTP